MKRIAPLPEITEDEPPFKPLTADEARRLREENPPVSVWWVVAGQAAVGLVVALGAWAVTGRQNVGWSAGYGALAVVIPAAIFARGLTGRFASLNARTAALGFMVWEMVKIAASFALLAAGAAAGDGTELAGAAGRPGADDEGVLGRVGVQAPQTQNELS